jgi:hypothetical protein
MRGFNRRQLLRLRSQMFSDGRGKSSRFGVRSFHSNNIHFVRILKFSSALFEPLSAKTIRSAFQNNCFGFCCRLLLLPA